MIFLIPSLLAAECTETFDGAALSQQLERWKNTPPEAAQIQTFLQCVRTPIDHPTALLVHQLMAKVTEGRHSVQSLRATTGGDDQNELLLSPPDGWLQVDGIYASTLDPDRAAILQWIGAGGEVRESRYWWPGEDLGTWASQPTSSGFRLELAAGWGAVLPGLEGLSLHAGLGFVVGSRWGALFGLSYEGLLGRSTLTLAAWEPRPGFVHGLRGFAGPHLQAGKLGVGLGASWTMSLGQWDEKTDGGASSTRGPAFGPGAALALDYSLSSRLGINVFGGGWTDGRGWYPSASLGLSFKP